jgi:hypothetical protein
VGAPRHGGGGLQALGTADGVASSLAMRPDRLKIRDKRRSDSGTKRIGKEGGCCIGCSPKNGGGAAAAHRSSMSEVAEDWSPPLPSFVF